MRINRLVLENFRNYAHCEVDLEPVSVVVGLNATGKSTLRMAIEYLLTGRVAGVTDMAGRGSRLLLREGAETGYVAAEVEFAAAEVGFAADEQWQKCRLKRAVGGKLEVEGADPGLPPADAITAALTQRFLDLRPAEQLDVLLQAAGAAADFDALVSMLKEPPAPGEECPAEAVKMVVGWEDDLRPLTGPALLDRLDKLAREARREANRAVKELAAVVGNAPEASAANAVDRNIVEAELAELKARRDRLLVKSGEARKLAEEKRALEEELARVKEQLAAAGEAGEAEDVRRQLADLDEALEKVWRERSELAEAEGRHRGQAETWRAALERVKETTDCPLVPAMACPADRETVVRWLEDQIAAADRLAAEARARLEAADKLHEELTAERARLARAGLAVQEKRDILKEQNRIMARLAQLEVKASGADAGRRAAEELKKVEAEIAARQQALEQLARAEALRDQAEKARARLARAKAEAEAAEWLVRAVPELRAGLLDHVLHHGAGVANSVLQALLPAWRVRFDPAEGLVVEDAAGRAVPLATLAASERLRVGVAVQAALAELSGLHLLIVDDVETLDPENRMALVEALLGLRDNGLIDAALVLAARGETEPADPGIPGLGVYEAVGGTVARVAPDPEVTA